MGSWFRKNRGFTLIELMIVIAIIALLVALAVPAYQDYTIRAKVSECINAMAVPKVKISEYHQVLGYWPNTAQEAGIDETLAAGSSGLSKYCRIQFYNEGQGDFAVLMDSANIDSALVGLNILPVMSPILNASGAVDWECTWGATSPEAMKYLPSSCRDVNIF